MFDVEWCSYHSKLRNVLWFKKHHSLFGWCYDNGIKGCSFEIILKQNLIDSNQNKYFKIEV